MSYHLTNLAWDIDGARDELNAHGLLVLLRLAHLSLQSSAECTVTVPELAVKCRMSDSGVRRQIRVLEALGLVTQFKDGRRSCYRLSILPRESV